MLLSLATFLTAAPALDAADARVDAFYPEGPLVVGEQILFAEMHKDRIVSWNGTATAVFYSSSGCGPTAIAPYADGYAVLCHLPNEVHVISAGGTLIKRLSRDGDGKPFVNPNDASADGRGGVYFSASGLFTPLAQPRGALMYLDRYGTIRGVAENIDYANGVHFDPRTRRVYVSEHLGRRVLAYPEIAPGRLGPPTVFKSFAKDAIVSRYDPVLTGPDGLESDTNGNLYVAYYGAGLLFVLSPDGDVLRRVSGLEPLITNVALTDGGRRLIITGCRPAPHKPYPGSVRRILNPVRAG